MLDRGLLLSGLVIVLAVYGASRRVPTGGLDRGELLDRLVAPVVVGLLAGRAAAAAIDDPTSLGSLRAFLVIRGGVEFWPGVAEFCAVAQSLHERKLLGRFSTFLEHVKETASGERVTRYNALFHWTVPVGREIEAGREVGRHHILTHCYWREAGPEFNNVNLMGVAHGTDKALILAHKVAIDEHLESLGIPVAYTNVFWGGRSEIKPSEISPLAYTAWCAEAGLVTKVMAPDA